MQCRDPRTVDRFNEILEKHYEHHKFLERLNHFEAGVQYLITEDQMLPLIKLDRLNTQLIRNAVKKCRKLRMGAKAYTPEMHKLGLTIYLYCLLQKR